MADMFLKFGTVKGDATEKNHKEWLSLSSISFGMNRNIQTQAGKVSNRDKGTVVMHDLVCTKSVDKSTPEMLNYACSGSTPKDAQIDLLRVEDGKTSVYMTYKLTDCLISSYQIDSVASTEPTEVFTLNFVKMQVDYVPHGKDNKAGGPTSAFYDPTDVVGG